MSLDKAKVHKYTDPINGDTLGVICIGNEGERFQVRFGDRIIAKYDLHEGDVIPYTVRENEISLKMDERTRS